MGLADRRYMREAYHRPRMTTILIVVLIACFVIQSLLLVYAGYDCTGTLGLSAEGIRQGKIWQLITFQFLHLCPWPWHVLFNCLGLFFFGRPVEEALGTRRFLSVYFLSGFVGGLLYVVTILVLPHHPDLPVVGASAGVCGMIAVFCTMNPMQELTMWLYILPITIRARYFLVFVGLYSLFGTLVPFDRTAHAAHLGGIILGISYVRWGAAVRDKLASWRPMGSRRGKREFVKTASGRVRPWPGVSSESPGDVPSEEFISREVDPILDKISAHGIQSLTERERKILEAARSKMAKR